MAETTKNDDGDKKPAPSLQLVFTMVGTILDTTWRMFVPTIGGTFVGIWADRAFGVKPWLTIAGITLGSVIAGLLLYMQIKRIKNNA